MPKQPERPRGYEIWEACRRSPNFFVSKVLGSHLWSKQREMLDSVRDNSRTAVRSCHGVGKTKGAAFCALWFLYSFPKSRVITTAPTWMQVEQVLWREIRVEFDKAGILNGELLHARLEVEPDWFALGLSTDKPERFQGHHAKHLLVIVDEASGVDQQIFDAAMGYMTTEGARLLLIGNPTQTSGEFYNAFHTHRALYNQLSISAFDSPNFTNEKCPPDVADLLVGSEYVEDARQKWGDGSVLWDVRVLGQFPALTDENVMGLRDVEAAMERHVEPAAKDEAVIGCDVARFGSDETVIAARRGNRLRIVKAYMKRDTMHTTGEIINAALELQRECGTFPRLVVDDDGVGGGVTDRLRELEYGVLGFHGGATAIEAEGYPNARSELWFTFADRLAALDLDTDDQLAADLTAPTYKLDSQGRRVVEPKDQTKKRIQRSPDRADAALLTLAPGMGDVEYVPSPWR